MTQRYPFPGAEKDALAPEPRMPGWRTKYEARMSADTTRAPEVFERVQQSIPSSSRLRMPFAGSISAPTLPRNRSVATAVFSRAER